MEGTTDNTGAASTASVASAAIAESASSNPAVPSAIASLEKAAAASSSDGTASSAAPTGIPASTPGNVGGSPTPAAGTTAQPALGADGNMIPLARHTRALENARREATTQLMNEIGWARGMNREQVERAARIARDLDADPNTFVRNLMAEIRQAQGMRGQIEESDMQDPKADLRSEDGREAYSAGAVRSLLQNAEQRLWNRFMQEVGPVRQFMNAQQENEARTNIINESRELARNTVKEMEDSLPHFKENKAAIREALAAIPVEVRQQIGSIAALYRAYNTVLTQNVFPGINQAAEQRVRAGFERKAASSVGTTAPNTSAQGQKAQLKDGDLDGLARHLERLSAG